MARRVVPSASRALVFFFFFGPFSTCMTGKSFTRMSMFAGTSAKEALAFRVCL